MTRLFASDFGCKGATLENGHQYNADRSGMVTVSDPSDVKTMVAGGYVIAGGMPKLKKYWVCDDCTWEASINSCGRCGSTSLRRVG
jgi:hypothetical protein